MGDYQKGLRQGFFKSHAAIKLADIPDLRDFSKSEIGAYTDTVAIDRLKAPHVGDLYLLPSNTWDIEGVGRVELVKGLRWQFQVESFANGCKVEAYRKAPSPLIDSYILYYNGALISTYPQYFLLIIN